MINLMKGMFFRLPQYNGLMQLRSRGRFTEQDAFDLLTSGLALLQPAH